MATGYVIALPEALDSTLRDVLPVIEHETRSPWWLIGSAALVVWGVPGIACQDIDLLTTLADADRLDRVWAGRRDPGFVPENDHLFRSRFARYTGFMLPVETMGGLELRVDATWRRVRPPDRRKRALPSGNLFLPSLPALIEVLHAFGRPKDLAKAEQARIFLATSPALADTTLA